MSEQQVDKASIAQIVAETCRQGGVGAAFAARRIARMTGELRSRYAKINGEARQDPPDIWLCDNYYVLEKESKQSRAELRTLRRRMDTAELGLLCAVVERVLCAGLPAITDDTAVCILSELSPHVRSGESLYAAFSTAVKAALLRIAHNACFVSRDDREIAYAITGFVALPSIDMEEVIQACSGVEKALLHDPAGVYPAMDEDSRRFYRYLLSKIAARERRPEEAVAAELLTKAENAAGTRRHVGWWITHHPVVTAPRRMRGALSMFCQIALPLFLCAAAALWAGNFWLLPLCYLPFWEILRPLVSQFSLMGMDIDFLPRMDLKKVEDKPKTVVLVSTLLPKTADAPGLSKRLEQLYFSNSDPDMYYCILADFKEADFPADEQDDSQVAASRKVIEALNAAYDGRFMLFLRGRTYSRTQKKYAGWERKRGAITEFVRFLGGKPTSVHTFVGDKSVLPKIKFLIALDADTTLLYESAQTLVSVAMHPLNAPVLGERGVVTEGYGILAPKISIDLKSAKATPFSRVMSGCGGVTAYETRDKDYYQDLFGESIFAGKGLLHVDAFRAALDARFPENQILSHDILEGSYLRCAFVSDVEMSDGAPPGMTAWLSRLHRWLRGDWQNIVFLLRRYRAGGKVWENPIAPLSRYKLFDNLRRSFSCVVSLTCLILALFAGEKTGAVLSWVGVLSVCFPSLWAAVNSLCSGGLFTLSRKFFTRTLPHTMELVAQGCLFLIMLPAQALLTLDAVLRSLWRLTLTRHNMLEWTTAAQADSRKMTLRGALIRYGPAEMLGFAYLALSRESPLALVGILFVLALPMAYFTAKPSPEDPHVLSEKDRDTLLSYNAAMWRYYEDFANEQNNYLPPDNIQQSPVYRVATRTSPTNIGMMLLSILAARDMGLIDTGGLYRRVERSLISVEKLRTWNGNLYNWYDTVTLEPLRPAFISCVDSGNFICSLVALAEGLREFVPRISGFAGLIARIEAIVDACDLTVFYNRKKHLFSIGYDMESESLSSSHYDFLMSEFRMTSYYAVARKIVGKKHWGSLARTMSRSGSYAGPVSWTGTAFEYFMPQLLLPVYDGSLVGESLTYCLYCQKRRVRGRNIPWGVSESAFYAFDNNLNYQYKAHGIQKLGVKRHLDRDLVISPYSTFLTIPLNPNSAMRNLGRLRELGVYGRYGFYEAVDFTEERVGADSLAITRSYMAHHIGMSMAASANALYDNIMQRRFMRDNYMKSAQEFLQEKITKNTVVYDDIKPGGVRPGREDRPRRREATDAIFPQSPRCMILSNGELTDVLTDTGAGYLKFGSIDLTRRGTDLLRRPQGFVALIKGSGGLLPATRAPFYESTAAYAVEQQEQAVTYRAAGAGLETALRCVIHPTVSCEQRHLTVKTASGRKETVDVLLYLEPVLAAYVDYSAHPAYSKLFVTAEYDAGTRSIIFRRRNRDATENTFLVVGFLEEREFTFETRREALMAAPEGLRGLANSCGENLSCAETGVPDACLALSFRMAVPAGSGASATLLICAARSRTEGVDSLISMRKAGLVEARYGAKSPIPLDSLEGRLGAALLSQLLFTTPHRENSPDRQKNRLGQSALWCTGISGDFPIALVEKPRELDEPVLHGYLRLHGILRAWGVEFDLVVFCDGEEEIAKLTSAVTACGGSLMLGVKGGIYLLSRRQLASETVTLIRAAARHCAIRKAPPEESDMLPYEPMTIRPSLPAALPDDAELTVDGGVFLDGRFYVDKSSPLPWCHVLATPVFGTLVSDKALGYTWALNARENKLTPWDNDICADNTGEMLLLGDGEDVYDLVNGSRASFFRDDARYEGFAGQMESRVRVTVSPKGCAKILDITLTNPTDKAREVRLAYYIEPVLGVTRETARHICPELHGDTLVLRNAFNTAARAFAGLKARTTSDTAGEVRFMTDRAAFLSGNWQTGTVAPENDPCAAIIFPLKLPAHREVGVRFILTYGQTEHAAARMADILMHSEEPVKSGKNSFFINTPDEALNQYINHFAPAQIAGSRLYGRCAFYQCGGAYGFRDQLQDVMAYLLIDPALCYRHILRCCAVQFEEGDVFHWWHDLPQNAGGLRGVRTSFSDDLLWLPLAAAEYVEKTGDESLLAVPCGYLAAETLPAHEHERYISPERSPLREDVYSHCVRALERAYNLGENGLPLIGCGDWNDGFSSVGLAGKGTSVWLALFLSLVLERFAALSEKADRADYAATCRQRASSLREAVDAHAWDGGWYLRAFYDDGSPMGSHQNDECAVDLLPQSFAVLADMPDTERVNLAMENAWNHLTDADLGLVRLFEQPFHRSAQRPGYVKAYPPGLRENGGQYTHSAIWFALALLKKGEIDKAWRVLRWINPAYRAADPALSARYKLEPYAIAADIYTHPGAPGRGGWSLYTGAAAWYYRAILENLLGMRLQGDRVAFTPHLPADWPEAGLSAAIRGTKLTVSIRRGDALGLTCDGKAVEDVLLDGGRHEVEVVIADATEGSGA